jgi:hypothetical protein
VHQPLIEKKLFFDVQAKLKTRVWPRILRHNFKYSRMLRCRTCGRCPVGSLAKGRVYYRCATMTCPTVNVREDRVVQDCTGPYSFTSHDATLSSGDVAITSRHVPAAEIHDAASAPSELPSEPT